MRRCPAYRSASVGGSCAARWWPCGWAHRAPTFRELATSPTARHACAVMITPWDFQTSGM
eukprot:3320665-Pyramimonas_sp.AAC.1